MITIFDIKRFALHDGPGIRTTIFMKGCPLRCKWCHNPESHSSGLEEYQENRVLDGKEITLARMYGKKVEHQALMEEILRDRVFFSESGGGVTFSGGEPLMQPKALLQLLEDTGKEGIHRAVDTSGHGPGKILLEIAGETDLFLYDLKLMDPHKHKEFTGLDNRLILENADLLLNAGADVIFRIPVIPGVNDTEEEINAFLDYFNQRKGSFREVHLLPYHKIGQEKYRRLEMEYSMSEIEVPEEQMILRIKTLIEDTGLKVLVGG